MAKVVSRQDLLDSSDVNLSADRFSKTAVQTQSDWPLEKLGGLLEIQNGYAFDSSGFNESNKGMPIIRIRDVNTGFTNTHYEGNFDEKFVVRNGDLLVGMDGDFRATIWSHGNALLNQRVCRLQNFHNVNKMFVFYLLKSKLEEIHAETFAVTVKHLSSKQIQDIEIPLPPLEIQEQIVAELDGYAAIIEGAKKIVDNWKPRIDVDPEWPTATIGEQVDIFNGSTPKRSEETYWTNGKVPWFTVADIRDQGREISYTSQFVTEKALAETSIKLLPADTVLLCCTASIGEYAYAKIPLTTNQQFNGLVVKNREILDPKYLYLVVSGFKDVLERMSGKSTFGFVSVGTLKELVFPLPPIEVQRDMIQQYEIEKSQVDSASSLVETYLGVSYKRIQNLWSS